MLDFEMYQGAQSNFPAAKEMGLGPAVVLRLKESVPPLSVLYFDRFFTTTRLMDKLIYEQYFATGFQESNLVILLKGVNLKREYPQMKKSWQ